MELDDLLFVDSLPVAFSLLVDDEQFLSGLYPLLVASRMDAGTIPSSYREVDPRCVAIGESLMVHWTYSHQHKGLSLHTDLLRRYIALAGAIQSSGQNPPPPGSF
jgi:hypothetical protein